MEHYFAKHALVTITLFPQYLYLLAKNQIRQTFLGGLTKGLRLFGGIDANQTDCVSRVVGDLERSAQTWNNLINITGGLLAYQKCNWQLISWHSPTGHMEIVHDTDQVLRIHDGKGAVAIIDYVPPNHPNVGLGYHLCSDGNQDPQLKVALEAICKICTNVASSSLSKSEVR